MRAVRHSLRNRSGLPRKLLPWWPRLYSLAVAMRATMAWDAEHQVLVIQRAVDAELSVGQVFEVEVYADAKTHGVQVCVNRVADVTANGVSFQPDPLAPISDALLLKTLNQVKRFS